MVSIVEAGREPLGVPVGVDWLLSTLDFLDPDLGVTLLFINAFAGVVMSWALAGGAACWLICWVLMEGMFPRRGCLSANPEMLEVKAPWEKPVSLLDGLEACPKRLPGP